MLDRPRHEELVKRIRKVGARLRMIGDGDVAGAIAPSLPDSGTDLYVGRRRVARSGVGGDGTKVSWWRHAGENVAT